MARSPAFMQDQLKIDLAFKVYLKSTQKRQYPNLPKVRLV